MISKLVLIVCAFLTFLKFSSALRSHFDSQHMPTGMVLLSLGALSSFLLIAYLAYLSASTVSATLGIIGIVLSYVLFGRSLGASSGGQLKVAFDPDLPSRIVKNGIYSKIRHPMYSAYIVFWTSFAASSNDWKSALPASLLILTYVCLALSEQRRLLASGNSSSYAELMSKTGMFWPKLW